MFFTGYAAISSLWSPFPLSAAKMIVYLICYCILFYLARMAWTQRWLTAKSVFWLMQGSIFIGILQTYLFGNYFGTMDEAQFDPRFTSFCSPQAFAAYMACSFAIILFSDLPIMRYKIPGALLALYVIVLTGSRFSLLGSVFIFVVWVAIRLIQKLGLIRATIYSAGAFTVFSVSLYSFLALVPNNRVTELINAGIIGGSTTAQLESVGTFLFRLEIYGEALSRISDRVEDRKLGLLFFGSGTSSGGDVEAAVHPEVADDNNRALHNEFLRSLYEWGIVGLILFCAVVAAIIAFVRSEGRDYRNFVPAAVLPLVIIAILVENTLPASAFPGGLAYALALSYHDPMSTVVSSASRAILS